MRRTPGTGSGDTEAISPFYTPKTSAPMRTLNPRFCTSDPKLLVRALQRQRQFRGQHRFALKGLRAGRRDVVFPAGTVQMVHLAGVSCRECAADHPFHTRTTWTAGVQAMWDDWLGRRAA